MFSTRCTIVLELRPNSNNGQIKYLSIYNHSDGYINNGVGGELFEHYNTYDKVLELLNWGDCSYVGSPYIKRDGESWRNVQPKLFDEIPQVEEDFQYLFKDGEWYVRDNKNYLEFTKLSDIFGVEIKKDDKISVDREFLEFLNGFLLGIKSIGVNVDHLLDKINEYLK